MSFSILGRQLINSDLGLQPWLELYFRFPYEVQASHYQIELLQKSLRVKPDEAGNHNNLGVFYTNEGRFEEAEKVHQRALTIRRKANPTGRSDIAQSNCNLAVVYHSRGDLKRAGELYRESLRDWEDLEKPPEDYEIVASNYADLLRSLGKNRKAMAIESRARKRRGR